MTNQNKRRIFEKGAKIENDVDKIDKNYKIHKGEDNEKIVHKIKGNKYTIRVYYKADSKEFNSVMIESEGLTLHASHIEVYKNFIDLYQEQRYYGAISEHNDRDIVTKLNEYLNK